MMLSHDFHTTQCAACAFGVWRGGCGHPATTHEDRVAAIQDACKLHTAGHPEPCVLKGEICAVVTVASIAAGQAELAAAIARAEAAEAALATAREEGAAHSVSRQETRP
jgi:hypothetical protein